MIQVFAPTIDSSWFTLKEVDATVRLALFRFFRFAYQVGLVLTSPDAIRTYKTVYNLIALIVVVLWAVAVTILKWIDSEAAVMTGEAEQVEVEAVAEPLVLEEVAADLRNEIGVSLQLMERGELLAVAAKLEGTPQALKLPRKMTDSRLRRKLQEVFTA